MKKATILSLLSCFILSLGAQNMTSPEDVYSITKTHYPFEYYKAQAKMWKIELKKDAKRPKAWINYFTAARMNNMLAPSSDTFRYDMDEIVADVQKAIPGSFEATYIQFWKLNQRMEGDDVLAKAYEMAPDRYETWEAQITRAEFARDTAKVRFFSQKWSQHPLYSNGITSWNYNLLQSLEPDAILLTHGDNDTYPLWLLQYVKGVRTDVKVLNASLITYKEYRDKVLQEAGIPPFPKKLEDFNDWPSFSLALGEHIIQKSERPVYTAITAMPQLREKHYNNFYLTGLAFKYDQDKFDHVAVLRNNYENKFLKDYLEINLANEFSSSVVNFMNQHYIPCLSVLYKHYKLSGESKKAMKTRDLLISIARKSGRESEVKDFLAKFN